ncbi:MAG: ATP-dependent zinc metalloprotease FtsH [Flavobacteriales bacterium]|jgi:cell division protease FtsH|nr:ATP-dependent zinc metalloprotease FtsH [Flavobacteriales bacterium]
MASHPPPPQKPAPGKPGQGPATKPPQLPRISWFWFIIILLLNIWFVRSFFGTGAEEPVSVPYTLFKAEVARGNVEEVYGKGESISGTFITPVTWPKDTAETRPVGAEAAAEVKHFITVLPAFADTRLEDLLLEHDVEISAEPIVEESNPLFSFLFMFGPALLIIAMYIWVFRRMRQGPMGGGMGGMGGLGGLGKSNVRRFDKETDRRVTFDDVAGIDDAEDELVEIVDFLKDPQKYTRLGGAAPKGVLLIGAPGTGKTLLARAVAGEAEVPFFSMSGSEFVEMIVGVGAARVRDLFKQAREHAPSIIFIDEIDSIGRARGMTALGGAQEQEQTLNQILAEMDGFSSTTGVIVLAATNQPDILDKALLRAGRFDRRVVVNLPDRTGREAILKVHTRKVPLAPNVSLAEVSAATPGLSGADLKNLVNEAALLAARRKQDDVRQADFMDALEKVMLGPARALLLKPADRARIAYHEGGHAILGLVVAGSDPVKRVTIVPRGQALGVTYQQAEEDRYNYSDGFLKSRIVGILGGRVAEEIVYGDRTTGAENDIEQATGIARRMVTRWGMSDALGMVELAGRENPYLSSGYGALPPKNISEHTAQLVDAEVRRIIQEAHAEATRLLTQHRPQLDALAKALLERETLDEAAIKEVTGLGS